MKGENVDKKRKLPKKAKDAVIKFMKPFRLQKDPIKYGLEPYMLLDQFDQKTHAICGNDEYKDLLLSATNDFINDEGIWVNNFFESVVECADGLVRIFYDSDFNILSVQMYRLVAEKEMELK